MKVMRDSATDCENSTNWVQRLPKTKGGISSLFTQYSTFFRQRFGIEIFEYAYYNFAMRDHTSPVLLHQDSPSIVVTWLNSSGMLERSKGLVVILPQPVLMSQQSMSIRKLWIPVHCLTQISDGRLVVFMEVLQRGLCAEGLGAEMLGGIELVGQYGETHVLLEVPQAWWIVLHTWKQHGEMS